MLFLFLIPLWGPLCLLLPPLQTYARFTGAPLKVHKVTNPWQSPSGTLCSWGVRKGWSRRRTEMWYKHVWIGS